MVSNSRGPQSLAGLIAELDEDKLTTSELVHRHLDTARLVKAFHRRLAGPYPPPNCDVLSEQPSGYR